jgi:hypothetical protein
VLEVSPDGCTGLEGNFAADVNVDFDVFHGVPNRRAAESSGPSQAGAPPDARD